MSSSQEFTNQKGKPEVVSFINEVSSLEEPSRKPRSKFIEGFREVFAWYPKNYDQPERKLLFKMDLIILTYACLGFFIKTLDASNVKYAYVSGLKEDLHLYGNELNWLNWIYQIGYVSGQLPNLLILSRPKYSRWLFPVLEIIYGVLTFAQSRVTHINHLYAIRFLVGFAEAPFYAGIHYCLGKWYGGSNYRGNAAELFKRAGAYYASANLASFVTGHLQAAAYKHLDGVHGYKGWQWLFLIDGIFTLPIAILGFAIWPGIPEAGKPWFFTQDEYDLALKRLKRFKIKEAGEITWNTFKDCFTSWPWYLFVLNYTLMCISWYPITYFALWLKAQGTYTVYQINKYPTACDAIGFFACFIGTTLASVYPPWIIYTIGASGPFVCGIILAIYDVPDGAVFFAFYYSYLMNTTTTILYSYVNVVLRQHSEMKAIVVASMMIFAQAIPVSLSFGIFPTVTKKHPTWQAPQWYIGWRIVIAVSVVVSASFGAIILLYRRDLVKGRTSYSKFSQDNRDNYSEEVSLEDISIDAENKDVVRERVREV